MERGKDGEGEEEDVQVVWVLDVEDTHVVETVTVLSRGKVGFVVEMSNTNGHVAQIHCSPSAQTTAVEMS